MTAITATIPAASARFTPLLERLLPGLFKVPFQKFAVDPCLVRYIMRVRVDLGADFKLQVVEGDVFLFEANGKIRDCFRLSSLAKEATKKRLSNITKLDVETVNSLVSEFLFKLKIGREEGNEKGGRRASFR